MIELKIGRLKILKDKINFILKNCLKITNNKRKLYNNNEKIIWDLTETIFILK